MFCYATGCTWEMPVRPPHARSSIPTLASVAEAAAVSRATVSRAFGAPEMLSRETVENVRATAARLGYEPNQAARALSTGRTGNLALVVPDITNPFFAVIMRGAQARARAEGFSLFLGDADETPTLEDELLSKLAPQVDGFVLVSPRMAHDRIQHHAARRPLVLINSDVPSLTRLLVDAGPSYARAVDLLAELGHRTIAYVAGPELSWSNAQRQQAVVAAAGSLDLNLTVLRTTRPSFAAGQDCAAQLIDGGMTAALAFDDTIAQGIIAGLAERAVSVPGDVSVVGCDGVTTTTTFPALTSIDTHCRAAGERVIEILISMLRGSDAGERRIVLPTDLVVRASTARAPARMGSARPRPGRAKTRPDTKPGRAAIAGSRS